MPRNLPHLTPIWGIDTPMGVLVAATPQMGVDTTPGGMPDPRMGGNGQVRHVGHRGGE